MPLEVERKFLVTGDFSAAVSRSTRIVQGYLNSDPERSVRVRIKGDEGFLTIKGPGNASGTTRYEWEKKISMPEAKELLALCEPGKIDKIRHLVPLGSHILEVDVFYGANTGLILAEAELADEAEFFERPPWLGEEVTHVPRYFNASLSRRPFGEWREADPAQEALED